ncbi:MaoC/PaaZ C-terminal domain-containing protein [Haloarchaeobius sp. TZWSO28]|uniref:MaoC/PaaZ C-terminal domain-containing protein n=1 Tax=Haloarchaeobius sp. TZWSO28 TaxID=3446119 RepID=UPI003EBEEB60
MPIDPVCGMDVEGADTEPVRFEGETYAFCSEDCRELFQTAPAEYVYRPQPHLSHVGSVTVPRIPYGRARGAFDLSIQHPGQLSVGDSVTFTRSLTEADVRTFAEATGDTNALHLSDAFATETRFGHRIVHGTLVSGLISAALACFPGLTIYLSQNLEFERPVDIGETMHATCEILEDLGERRFELSTRIENDAGKTVIDGTAVVLVDPLPSLS